MIGKIDILIAEDDGNDRFLVSRAFANNANDFCLTFACDGQEAIDYLQNGTRARLLLLDLKMPRMDGFQVLEWLVSNRANRPEHVVVLSSSVDPRDMERTRQLGADLHVTKPHDSREYVRIARRLLEDASAARTPEPTASPSLAIAPSPA